MKQVKVHLVFMSGKSPAIAISSSAIKMSTRYKIEISDNGVYVKPSNSGYKPKHWAKNRGCIVISSHLLPYDKDMTIPGKTGRIAIMTATDEHGGFRIPPFNKNYVSYTERKTRSDKNQKVLDLQKPVAKESQESEVTILDIDSVYLDGKTTKGPFKVVLTGNRMVLVK